MSLLSTAANNFHAPEPYNRGDNMTPTTTRPSTAPSTHASHIARPDDATTPTRSTLGALASQKPLPSATAFPSAIPPITKAETDKSAPLPQRHGSIVSVQSKRSHDVDMDDSDDGDDASDDGSVNPDGSKSNKKKKGQKFYCTDFPPCTLSFTRSEHLARHIRKHTGERPFQCHCSRRFSRLDNLRQHAQTVHVNEDIPQDSLAASGTRFQRQVRTERARPIGNRSRASTVGSQSSGGRGHHRNSLSASSIGSVMSNYSQRDDPRKRPSPLPLPSDPRSRLSLETYNMRPGSPSGQLYGPASPGGYHTPTSTTNSVGQNSPRWPGMQSPSSGHPRTQSLFNDNRTPGRRLSVPSGTSPCQAYPVPAYGPQLSPLNSSNSAVFPTLLSNAPNLGLSSPTSSIGSGSSWSRRDSVAASMVDGDPRRRTWHPETQSNFTSSRLNVVTTPSHYQTPVYQYPPPPPPPAFTLPSQNTPSHATRLPGIESFDPLRPQTPPRRETSPMALDTPSRMASHSMEGYRHDEQTLFQPPRWDRSLAQNLNGLEIAPGGGHPPDSAPSWASEADRAVQGQAAERMSQQSVRFEQACHQPSHYANLHPQHVSAPPLTPRAAKRAGWYNGPLKTDRRAQRISPEHSSSPEGVPGTPQSSNVNDYHPSIVHASGWIEPSHPGHHIQDPRTVQHMQMPAQVSSAHYQPYSAPATDNYTYAHHDVQMAANENMHREGQSQMPKANNDLHRLETLVAVATGENTATRAY